MKSKSGFTIVELLIVVVVIAILASISIVAYNAIQDRARTAAWVSRIDEWTKLLYIYKADTGTYPSTGVYETCLGKDLIAADGFSASQCYRNTGGYNLSLGSTVNNALETTFGNLPTGSLPVMHTFDPANGTAGYARGIIYNFNSATNTGYIQYYLDKGTSSGAGGCLRGDSLEYAGYSTNHVRCRRSLP